MRLAPFVWLSVFVFPITAFANFTYVDFASTAGLNMVGTTAQAGNVLRMTPASEQHIGGVWRTDRQDIAGGFDTIFRFRLSEPGPFNGADGLAFVVQDANVNALGGIGLDIGYAGIPRSLAIEIDTFVNSDFGDPASQHLGILSRGTLPNSPNHAVAGLGLATLTGDLYDGVERSMRVRYVPGTLEVYFNGSAVPTMSAAVSLPTLIGSADGRAFVGFTSATGAAWGNHDLHSWSFQTVPGPGTMAVAVLACLGGVSVRGRRRTAS